MTGKAHILLVEDYKANVLVATALLEEFGYDYIVANNGQEAVQFVKTQSFDLILMDVQMPGIDGFEATHFIREWEKNQAGGHRPIIGMTAHALKGDRERCIAAGMDDYIAKPFHPDEFKSKLIKYLS
jgi:chemotaxis family two-component system sensor kinase Cph1